MLYRHAELVLRDLSSHPDARQKANRPALAQANRDVESSLKKLEVLRPRITRRFERHEQSLRDRNARITPGSDVNVPPFREQSTLHNPNKEVHYVSDPAIINGAEGLAAGDNGDLAIRLAHKELRRRATARKATRQAGISEEVEQERRVAGLWGNWEEALARDDKGINQESLSRQMQNVRLQVEGSVRDSPRNGKFSQPFDSQRFPYHYPAVPEHSAKVAQPASSLHLMGDVSLHSSAFPTPPRPPPKDSKSPVTEILPTRPGKDLNRSYEIPSRSSTSSPTAHDLKPSDFIFRPSAYLENGSPLRTIFLPQNLRHKFLTLARPNTHANLETCGILCGTLISNALFISKLVIPEQKSTSDTCETLNESGLFDYVDGEDLMVLGWIHTHPTQTCFMSSRDLHTHCGYQVMMPESIAIVCAPSKEEWVCSGNTLYAWANTVVAGVSSA